MTAGSANRRYCSFCGKSQHEVCRLFAPPGYVAICNECVDLFQNINREKAAAPDLAALRNALCSIQLEAVSAMNALANLAAQIPDPVVRDAGA